MLHARGEREGRRVDRGRGRVSQAEAAERRKRNMASSTYHTYYGSTLGLFFFSSKSPPPSSYSPGAMYDSPLSYATHHAPHAISGLTLEQQQQAAYFHTFGMPGYRGGHGMNAAAAAIHDDGDR